MGEIASSKSGFVTHFLYFLYRKGLKNCPEQFWSQDLKERSAHCLMLGYNFIEKVNFWKAIREINSSVASNFKLSIAFVSTS